MYDFCITVIIIVLVLLPILLVALAIRALLKKPIKKLAKCIGILAIVFALAFVLGVILTPSFSCEHEYEKIDEVEATCYETGVITNECVLCGLRTTEKTSLNHDWVGIGGFSATCTEDGYVLESCSLCGETRKNVTANAKGHVMGIVSERKPTYEAEGETVSRCTVCGYEYSEKAEKLKIEPIDFNGLHIEFGGYTFAKVDNPYFELHGTPVVKIEATITNNKTTPSHLNYFDYQLFNTSGLESEDVSFLFEDDMFAASDVLPGKSYTKYFHIVYDGDGVYTIYFEYLFDEKTVEIIVEKP